MNRSGLEMRIIVGVLSALLLAGGVFVIATQGAKGIDPCSMYFLVEEVSNKLGPLFNAPSCPLKGGAT